MPRGGYRGNRKGGRWSKGKKAGKAGSKHSDDSNRARKSRTKLHISFDPEARKEYVTGFHKRKVARRKKAAEDFAAAERMAKIAARKEIRDARITPQAAALASQHEKQRKKVRALMKGLDSGDGKGGKDGSESSSESSSSDEGMAVVAVEEVDVDELAFDVSSTSGDEVGDGGESESYESSDGGDGSGAKIVRKGASLVVTDSATVTTATVKPMSLGDTKLMDFDFEGLYSDEDGDSDGNGDGASGSKASKGGKKGDVDDGGFSSRYKPSEDLASMPGSLQLKYIQMKRKKYDPLSRKRRRESRRVSGRGGSKKQCRRKNKC